MNRRSFLLLLFYLAVQSSTAQEYKFLIHFKDKNNSGYDISNPSAFLSIKSIRRREKFHIPVNSADLPLTPAYVDSLLSVPSVLILNRSKWFNQILISVPDSLILQEILKFSFVISAEPVSNRHIKKIKDKISVDKHFLNNTQLVSENIKTNFSVSSSINYGASAGQIQIHHGNFLHDQRFHGESMTIAILDNGFNNYLNNPAFDSLRMAHRILGSYDFVNHKVSVNEEETHGSNCFSILAANIPGVLVGSAPSANYWLFKTEDNNSESPVEEQNWVAAAEFADSVGVDLISTSLGYGYFDNPVYNLNYPERDGQSSLVTKAANMAVARGMIVTASVGNSGVDPTEIKYASCPADGDLVYAVGAVDIAGVIAGFSSWGPNAAGQVKPDGVSVGSGTSFIAPDGNAYSGNGTSFSNPNLAGLITCLWQAFPELGPMDILSAVRQSSTQFNHPDSRYGYGLPDFEKAYHLLLIKKLPQLIQSAGNDRVYAFPVPFLRNFTVFLNPVISGNANIRLMDVNGKTIQSENIAIVANQLQLFEFKVDLPLTAGVYFLKYADQVYSKTIKLLKK